MIAFASAIIVVTFMSSLITIGLSSSEHVHRIARNVIYVTIGVALVVAVIIGTLD